MIWIVLLLWIPSVLGVAFCPDPKRDGCSLSMRYSWKDIELLAPIPRISHVSIIEFDDSCKVSISVHRDFRRIAAKNRSHQVAMKGTPCEATTKDFSVGFSSFDIRGPIAVHTNGLGTIIGRKYALLDLMNEHLRPERLLRLPDHGEIEHHQSFDTILLLLGEWGWTWQHFVQDLVDVIGILLDVLRADPNIKILVDAPHDLFPQRQQLLEILGLTDRLIFSLADDAPTKFYGTERLLFIKKDTPMPGATQQGLHRIRTEVRTSLKCLDKSHRDLFLMWTRPRGFRFLKNADLVETRLRSFVNATFGSRVEVMTYDPGKLDLAVSLARSCRAVGVLHVHGGSLFHSLTMPKNSVVIELIPKDGMCTTGFHFDSLLNLEYFQIGIDGHREGEVQLNLMDLDITLQNVASYLRGQF